MERPKKNRIVEIRKYFSDAGTPIDSRDADYILRVAMNQETEFVDKLRHLAAVHDRVICEDVVEAIMVMVGNGMDNDTIDLAKQFKNDFRNMISKRFAHARTVNAAD